MFSIDNSFNITLCFSYPHRQIPNNNNSSSNPHRNKLLTQEVLVLMEFPEEP